MTKYCPSCKKSKELSHFNKLKNSKDGHAAYCRICVSNKQKLRYQADKTTHIQYMRKQALKAYGISEDDYEKMYISQNGLCKICDQPQKSRTKKRLCIDHDHNTGKVRGLLCDRCNKAIGLLKEDPDIVRKAELYLRDSYMQTNEEGLKLLHSFEGCKLESYQDIVGVWTIGYGTTGPDIVKGLKWTQQQVDERFKKDLGRFEKGVEAAVKVPLTSNQFSALVCFAYNVGIQAMSGSTLVKLLNAGKTAEAADQFLRWNKAGGKEVKGLTRRREAERALFLKPEVQSPKTNSLLPDGPSDDEINKKLEAIEKGLKK